MEVYLVFQRTRQVDEPRPHEAVDVFRTYEAAKKFVDSNTDSNRRIENVTAMYVYDKVKNPYEHAHIEGLMLRWNNDEILYMTELETEFPGKNKSRCRTIRAIIKKEINE